MKIKILFLTFCSSLLLFGCATPVITPASVNSTTGAISPAVTNYVPNATLATVTSYAGAAAPFIPAPYGTLLNVGLALATGVAGMVAARKNGQLNTVTAAANSIIQGVESAGAGAAPVKQAVAAQSLANGTADIVEALVNKVTGS